MIFLIIGTLFFILDIIYIQKWKKVKKLLAINQLMNVAKYLNGDQEPDFKKEELKFFIYINDKNNIDISDNYFIKEYFVYFRTKELAKQAIDILEEETIHLTLSQTIKSTT